MCAHQEGEEEGWPRMKVCKMVGAGMMMMMMMGFSPPSSAIFPREETHFLPDELRAGLIGGREYSVAVTVPGFRFRSGRDQIEEIGKSGGK